MDGRIIIFVLLIVLVVILDDNFVVRDVKVVQNMLDISKMGRCFVELMDSLDIFLYDLFELM